MPAGSIVIDLLLRTGGLETDSKRAEKRLAELGKAAKQAGVVLGTAIVAGASAAVVSLKATINSMDELSKAAQRVGLPTEELSKLNYAAGLADVSLDTLVTSLGRVTKAQADALKGTSEQARLFEALGIAIKDSDGALRSSSDVLKDFADKFQALDGSPEAIAAGIKLFGRSFQELVPLLANGSQGLRDAFDEAERLNAVLGGQAGKDAETFNDSLTKLGAAAKGVGLQVASDLLPQLNRFTENLVALASDGNRTTEVANSITNAIDGVGTAFNIAYTPIRKLGDFISGLTQAFYGFKTIAQGVIDLDYSKIKIGASVAQAGADEAYFGPAKSAVAKKPGIVFAGEGKEPEGLFKMSAGEVAARKQAGALQEALSKALAGPSKAKSAGGSSKAAKEPLDFAKDARAELEKLIETESRAREQFDAMAASLAGPLADATYRYKQDQAELNELAKTGVIANDALATAQANLTAAYEKDVAAINARLSPGQQLLKDLEQERIGLGLSAEQQEIYNNLKYAGVDANSALGQSIVESTAALQDAREQAAFLDELKDGLGNLFVDFVSGAKSAKEAFGDFADAIYARALQFVADKAINALFDAFSGKEGSGGSESSGGFADLLSSFGSSGFFGGGKAGGGDVIAGRSYLVGEAGPERFVPRTSGLIMTAGATAGGGGGNALNQTNNFILQASRDSRTQGQIAQKVGYETGLATRRNS